MYLFSILNPLTGKYVMWFCNTSKQVRNALGSIPIYDYWKSVLRWWFGQVSYSKLEAVCYNQQIEHKQTIACEVSML